MKDWLKFWAWVVVVCFFVWGVYWVAKSFSYWLFYEDMVIDTIKETVQQQYLK